MGFLKGFIQGSFRPSLGIRLLGLGFRDVDADDDVVVDDDDMMIMLMK